MPEASPHREPDPADPTPPTPLERDYVAAVFGLAVLIALVVAIDVIFRGDVSIGILYILPILAGVALRSVRAVYLLTPLMVVADYAFLWLGPPPPDPIVALANRTLSAIALIGVAILVARHIRSTLAVEAQRRRLAHLVEMKTEFVRAVSHDIRGPVGAILGYADLLLADDLEPPTAAMQTRLLRGIQRSAQGVLSLTDNLLNAARMDTEEFPVERVPFDVVALVADVADEIGDDARSVYPRLHFQMPRSLIIISDPLRVRQVLLNLLSNALKFAPRDTIVDVRLTEHDTAAVVQVRDRGPGIATDDHERIFESFYQTAAGRSKGGFGIGLPLARRLARLLGGDVEVESVVGEGSTFTLRLPKGQE